MTTRPQREPLNKKARAAIELYANAQVVNQANGQPANTLLIGFVLKAERMRRAELYTWLQKRGYQWNGGTWQWMSKSRTRSKQ
jgi:hypothetical protein